MTKITCQGCGKDLVVDGKPVVNIHRVSHRSDGTPIRGQVVRVPVRSSGLYCRSCCDERVDTARRSLAGH